MAIDLQDKVIIVTGGSSGIGRATCLACARAGMHVVVAARGGPAVQETAAAVERLGRQALPVACDVGQDQDVKRMVAQTIERFGRLDVMFANAGYGLYRSVLDTTDQEMREIFEVNFFGTIRCIRESMPHLCRSPGGGHLLICSSAASEISIPMYGFYAATKAAQDAIGGALRAELMNENVRVSTVHPIGTRTEFFEAAGRRARLKNATLNTPSALMQSPERVARAIVRCLRRPCPEVWPSISARWGLALTTALPRLSAWSLRRMMRDRLASPQPCEEATS